MPKMDDIFVSGSIKDGVHLDFVKDEGNAVEADKPGTDEDSATSSSE